MKRRRGIVHPPTMDGALGWNFPAMRCARRYAVDELGVLELLHQGSLALTFRTLLDKTTSVA